MDTGGGDRRSESDAERADHRESTLLPMLFGGLALIVIGAGVVMTMV